MEPTIIGYAFIALLALAALSGIIGSFRDGDDHRNRYRPNENQFPDPLRHDDYAHNRPIIIYTTAPHDPYYHQQHGYYGQRRPFWSPVLVVLALGAGLVYYLSIQDTNSNKVNNNSPKKEEALPTKKRETKEDNINKIYPNGKPRYVNQTPFHTEKWFTTIPGYTSLSEARAAMHKIASAVKEKKVTFYLSQPTKNQFMVYAPAKSEAEAEEIQQLIIDHFNELREYCPTAPEIMNVQ